MDVVNGKIVETVTVAGTETIRRGGNGTTTTTTTSSSGGKRQIMADQQHAWSGSRAFRGHGLAADARAETVRPQQASAGGAAQWTPTWASGMFVDDDSSLVAAVPAVLASASPRWLPRASERGGRGAHGFMGMPEPHRPGWRRAADQESSRMAEFGRDHVPQALGLKPSRLRVVDGGSAGSVRDQLPGSFARVAAADWAPTWAPSTEPMTGSWLAVSTAARAAAADWASTWAPSIELMAGSRLAMSTVARSGADYGSPQQPGHCPSWKWSTSSPKRSNSGVCCPRCGSVDQQGQHHFDASPCTEVKLDEEMTLFEKQLTQTVSGHLLNQTSVTSSCCREIVESSAPVVTDAGDAATSSTEKKVDELATVPTATLKRKRSGLSDGDVEGEWGWKQPMKLLVRKVLTVSDVGELGRIILPKKDAESQCFPQIDNKEGRVLEMEDYNASKRWYFRFKYWSNNKSKMYVLENTGDFVKFYCLKEHDMFVIYEDGCKKLIVCGQKKGNGDSLEPVLERSEISLSETQAINSEDKIS